MTTKELKIEIRELRKIKRDCKAGTPERIDLHRKLKELRTKLEQSQIVNKEKDALITELRALDKWFDKLGIDLNQFTVEELNKNLERKRKKANAEKIK